MIVCMLVIDAALIMVAFELYKISKELKQEAKKYVSYETKENKND